MTTYSLVTPVTHQNAIEIATSELKSVGDGGNHRESTKSKNLCLLVKPDSIQPFMVVKSTDPLTKFSLGQIVATRGAIGLAQIHQISLRQLLFRHAVGDWGELCHEDQQANFSALAHGGRLMSSYVIRTASPNHSARSEQCEVKFWIITEADRAVSTVLLPEEY